MPSFSFSSKQKIPAFYLSNSRSELVLIATEFQNSLFQYLIGIRSLQSSYVKRGEASENRIKEVKNRYF